MLMIAKVPFLTLYDILIQYMQGQENKFASMPHGVMVISYNRSKNQIAFYFMENLYNFIKNRKMIQSKIRLLQKLHPLLSTLSTTKRQSKHEVSRLLDYPPY